MVRKSPSRRKKSGGRQITGSGRNIPATPLNPKYRVIVWLEYAITSTEKTRAFTYAELLKLAEAQLLSREIQKVVPSELTAAKVFTYVELAMAEAWASPYANPTVAVATPSTYTNVPRIDLTVGPTSAIMPKSTVADTCVGIGERAYAKVRGNSSTWGGSTSTAVAAVVDWQTENQVAGSLFLPITLKFHVNLW
jgi:hypothetical protein